MAEDDQDNITLPDEAFNAPTPIDNINERRYVTHQNGNIATLDFLEGEPRTKEEIDEVMTAMAHVVDVRLLEPINPDSDEENLYNSFLYRQIDNNVWIGAFTTEEIDAWMTTYGFDSLDLTMAMHLAYTQGLLLGKLSEAVDDMSEYIRIDNPIDTLAEQQQEDTNPEQQQRDKDNSEQVNEEQMDNRNTEEQPKEQTN